MLTIVSYLCIGIHFVTKDYQYAQLLCKDTKTERNGKIYFVIPEAKYLHECGDRQHLCHSKVHHYLSFEFFHIFKMESALFFSTKHVWNP